MKFIWCFFIIGFLALGSGLVSAQTSAPAAAPAAAQQAPAQIPGIIVVKRVTGSVTAMNNATKVVRPIKNDDRVTQGETIVTSKDRQSSVILVFSNGATIQLKADSQLNIEEFLMDSWDKDIDLADLKEEPGTSKTKLNMARGELIGKVAKLNRDKGSSFDIQTPVGAAGIRGTTFRIVFRPDPINPSRLTFSVSTVEGRVDLQMQGTVTTSAPLPVGADKEIVVNIDVKVDATTGAITVTAPPAPVQTAVTMSPETTAVIAQATQQVVEAVQNVIIATPPPAETPKEETKAIEQTEEKKDTTTTEEKKDTATPEEKKDTTTPEQKQETQATEQTQSTTTDTSNSTTGTAGSSSDSTTGTSTTGSSTSTGTTTGTGSTPTPTPPVVTPPVTTPVVAPPVVPVLPRITSGEGNPG
ncbi:MAG: FecR domain-containing protein [Opitutaceae bacterium]|jgi:hypothetical protein